MKIIQLHDAGVFQTQNSGCHKNSYIGPEVFYE